MVSTKRQLSGNSVTDVRNLATTFFPQKLSPGVGIKALQLREERVHRDAAKDIPILLSAVCTEEVSILLLSLR